VSSPLRRSWLLLVLLTGCHLLSVRAADPMPKTPAKGIDFSKLPPGTVFVIGEDGKDVLQQPGVVVISAEEFIKMRDELAQLKKQLTSEKPGFAGQLKLAGRVEGDLVHLQARYEFETVKAKALVPLGCKNAWPRTATLDDGQLPLLPPPGDDGFVVQVEKPGAHRLTLELDQAVTSRGTKTHERGFDLNLPGAAVTLLEHLDLPPGVKEVRIAGRTFLPQNLSSRNDKRQLIALGPIDKLEVVWKGQAPQQQGDALPEAEGKVTVNVDETQVVTEAELRLQLRSGQTKEWRLQAPPGPQTKVEVDFPIGDERTTADGKNPAEIRARLLEQLAPLVEQGDAKNPVYTIRLKEASAEPLLVRIRTQQQRTAKTTIGPFVVLGAVRQQGIIKVMASPDLRLRYKTRGDVSQREVSEEQRRGNNTVALFSYWNLPQPAKDNQLAPSPLEIDSEMVKGAVETSVHHILRLTPQGWLVHSEIDVKPERIEIERFEVELPANYEVKASPPALVESDLEIRETGQPRRIGTVKLTQRRGQPFKVVLTGLWPLPEEPKAGVVTIPLLRPIQTLDRGGKVTASVPDDRELLIVREAGMQTLPPGKRQHALEFDRAPLRLDVAWREYRAELPVEMLIDLTLTDRQAQVRQRLRFQFPPEAMRQVMLKVADFPDDRTPVATGATLTPQGRGGWSFPLKDATLTLDYSFTPQPDKTGSFAVPIFWPEGVSHGQTKVRVWSDPGSQPLVDGKQWEEAPLEVTPDRDSLPALVLRSGALQAPLRLKQRAATALPTVAVDRVLVQATVGDGGHQGYRARFLIAKVSARYLDIELPGPPAGLNLELLLDGKRAGSLQTVDDDGNEAENGRIVRLPIEPELYRRKVVVLDLRYQMSPTRGDSGSRWQARFSPPRLRGNVFAGRVRWQVGLPTDRVPLYATGQTLVEQRWGLRGWLPGPRAAVSSLDLERWFTGNPDLRLAGNENAAEVGSRNSELVCWQAELAPLLLLHVSEQTWLLTCSAVVLIAGIGLYFASAMPRLFGACVSLLCLVLVIVGIFWPSILPAVIYGAQPGLAVLLLVIGYLWWRQNSYRRQVVFMPGFSRLSGGSSVMRTGSSQRHRGEPSTVDAPRLAAPDLGSRTLPELGSRQELIPRAPQSEGSRQSGVGSKQP
jgi:hypothetical protein